ncbi:N-acetylmuramoyl-L-alanine amidase [Natronospirillum operosum]|nr:N-acetylmuramoyl-L-alanine amidase [Natronospirillum operosum]
MMRYLLVLLPLLLLSSSAFSTSVSNIRLWQAPDHTRIVFDLTQEVDHRVFTLSGPDRVVIDMTDTSLSGSYSDLELSDSGISSIRSARREDGSLRVVLDLDTELTPRSFVLAPNEQYGHRLVVDLQRDDRTSPTIEAAREVRRAETDGERDIIIAIDAGHGGEDPGAIGVQGTYEKHVAMAIAREMERIVEDAEGFTPFMVRTGDYYISLVRRRQLAREANADFFVSIHADAFTSPQPSGAAVYALSDSGATSTMAEYLASSENRADRIGGVSGVDMQDMDAMVREVIVDLAMTYSMQEGLTIGEQVLQRMGEVTNLHRRRVEQAGFAVLKSPDVPSILVEAGFMSNPRDEANLGSQGYRQRLARSVFAGIEDYFHDNPPPGTWVYSQRRSGNQLSSYTVRQGDTLSSIASRHGITVNRLQELNNMNSDVLRIGQTLRVPSG